jgi:AraC-like DNA-binding protein
MALERFQETSNIREVVAESGYSHRRFIGLFREAAGLTPKLYCRVRRFARALRFIRCDRRPDWADLALDCGYSDQAHFVRDFVEFSGMTPGEYRRVSPEMPHHCPAPKVNFVQERADRVS